MYVSGAPLWCENVILYWVTDDWMIMKKLQSIQNTIQYETGVEKHKKKRVEVIESILW